MAFDKEGLDSYIDVAQRIADFREQYPEGSLQPADPARPWEQAVVTGTKKDGTPFAATMIVYTAAAYRTPDDKRPGIGIAWEPFPGRTPYTLGSELMNAETSAWGRAIVAALASDSKRGVSSREEIRNRQAESGMSPEVVAAVIEDTNRHHREAEERMAVKAASEPQRTRTRIPGPDHERLRDGTARGRVDGAKRGPLPPDEDHWTGQPPGEFDTAAVAPEDQPGSIDGRQRALIFGAFKTLAITDPAAQRATLGEILGRDVSTRKSLSYVDAEKVLKALDARKASIKAAAS